MLIKAEVNYTNDSDPDPDLESLYHIRHYSKYLYAASWKDKTDYSTGLYFKIGEGSLDIGITLLGFHLAFAIIYNRSIR